MEPEAQRQQLQRDIGNFVLGTARYPSPNILRAAVARAKVRCVTVSLRRENARGDGSAFGTLIRDLNVRVLPNTAGCRTAKEAITTAHMARELFATDWIKLEVIANDSTLHPDVFGLVEAAEQLCKDGFRVFPYTTDDLSVATRLVACGCAALMPWGSLIGSGKGLSHPDGIRRMREAFPDTFLVVDAGLGAPSHATHAMELGADAVLLNTAVAEASDPVQMAEAFALATRAGELAYRSGLMPKRDFAAASTPMAGLPALSLTR